MRARVLFPDRVREYEVTEEEGSNTRNAAQCLECGVIVESRSRHDFQSCGCGAIFVDGGKDYKRFGFTPGKRYKIL